MKIALNIPKRNHIQPNQPAILLLDIEITANLGFIWGKYEQNVIEYEHEWYILCYAAKWLGKPTFVKSLPDFPGYDSHKDNDKALVKTLWELLDEADVVIAHNGNSFDLKKINARFSFHGLPPPSPYKSIDTLRIARKYYSFNSNKLDDLGQYLKLGQKAETGGFKLWMGCMAGDRQSWAKMVKYNKQDVDLLEKVYLHFLPWIQHHPAQGMYNDKMTCGRCGGTKFQSRGYKTNVGKKIKQVQCTNCGGWALVKKDTVKLA